MANYKTVPNQKVVKVNKEVCDKQHLYAAINLEAMECAAQVLGAGAFKLWIYFAKNQDNFEFALSSKAVETTFGMKIKQYNNAIDELIEKNYLVMTKGNNYTFNELPVIPKSNNDVKPKSNNVVIPKSNNTLCPKDIRNNTDTTLDNTTDNTGEIDECSLASSANSSISESVVQRVSKREMLALGVPYEVIDEAKSLYRIKATNKIVRAI